MLHSSTPRNLLKQEKQEQHPKKQEQHLIFQAPETFNPRAWSFSFTGVKL